MHAQLLEYEFSANVFLTSFLLHAHFSALTTSFQLSFTFRNAPLQFLYTILHYFYPHSAFTPLLYFQVLSNLQLFDNTSLQFIRNSLLLLISNSPYCPKEIKDILESCWELVPEVRVVCLEIFP